MTTADDSQDGSDVDPDANGDPTDNDVPTPVTFTETPSIAIGKLAIGEPINNNDGTYTLTYRIKVENTGDIVLNNIQVTDDLSATFSGLTLTNVSAVVSTDPPTTNWTINGSYDGLSTGDINLLSSSNSLVVGEFGEHDIGR